MIYTFNLNGKVKVLEKVLSYLSKLAIKQKYSRFQWWTLKTNDPAIQFYKNIGAKN